MNTSKLAVAAVISLGMTAPALAATIGIDFVGQNPDLKVAPSATAGIPEIAQANWNPLQVSNNDANGYNNSGSLVTIVDSDGNPVNGMTVTVTPLDGGLWPKDGADWGFTGSNADLQKGLVWSKFRITITGIPYAEYDIYAYAGADGNAGAGKVSISVAEDAEGSVDADSTKYYRVAWLAGQFVRSDAATLDDAIAESGNYVVFSGNTAKDVWIDWDGTVDGGWTGATAIQIVPVPEPSALAGLALAGVALCARRRRIA